MPSGALGRNSNFYNFCSNGTDLEWTVAEMDIVFNDNVNWQYGPSPATLQQIDFETIAVHELGHGHQLAHIIEPNAIMHYLFASGQTNRILSENDILGGSDVQNRNTSNPVCEIGLMTNYNCALGIDDIDLTSHLIIYPNPAKNQIFIKNEHHAAIEKVEMFDVTGRWVKISNSQGTTGLFTLDTSDLSSGVYMVNINVENKLLTKKIIIE